MRGQKKNLFDREKRSVELHLLFLGGGKEYEKEELVSLLFISHMRNTAATAEVMQR
jgi:hypothetical protein